MQEIKDLNDFLNFSNIYKYIIVDFYANWCGPCKRIYPVIEQLYKKHQQIKFLKVNVDICPDIVSKYNISALPTFLYIKNNEVVDIFVGANPKSIEEKLIKLL